MASRTVVSATGASIEVVTDDDWCLTAGVSPKSLQIWYRSKPLVFRELWEHGPVVDKSGRSSKILFDRIREHYPNTVYELSDSKALPTLMSEAANAAAFHRETNGKRTYRIELVAMPETWYEKLRWDIGGGVMPTYAATPVEFPNPPTEPSLTIDEWNRTGAEGFNSETSTFDIPEDMGPSIEVEIAGQVAMELLTRVVEIISTGGSEGMSGVRIRQLTSELDTAASRLGQRLEENDRMRKQLRVTGEELAAVKMERDSLRQRLRQTEANLNSALKGESASAVTTEVMKRVDRIMRETPRPNPREET
jgi:regulator of replication initiation timing